MYEYEGPGNGTFRFRMTTGRMYEPGRSWSGVRASLLLIFLLTKNHPWLGTVPLDGGNLDVVLACNDGRAFRITEWDLELDQ